MLSDFNNFVDGVMLIPFFLQILPTHFSTRLGNKW